MHRCATPAAFDNQIWHLLYDWDRCAAALQLQPPAENPYCSCTWLDTRQARRGLQLQPLWENPCCICRLTGTALRPGAAAGAAAPY